MDLSAILYSSAFISICGFITQCISLQLQSNLSQDMVCIGCEGLLTELYKRLTKASSDYMEVRVIDAMDGICTNENFKVYDYIPPKMVRACKYTIDKFDEDIENALISYFRPPVGTLEILQVKICYNMTEYCEGHDREAEKNKKEQTFKMTVDGEEREFPVKYGGDEDGEGGEEGENPAAQEGGGAAGEEPETRPDERSEPADEESELSVEENHDEL